MPTTKTEPERRQTGVKLDTELLREFKVLAARNDTTLGELLELSLIHISLALGVKSACFLPLVARERLLGTLNVGRFPERAFTQEMCIRDRFGS